MVKSITLEVVGPQKLHCGGCQERVERLLKGVAGVRQVRASARTQRIEVLFDTGVLKPSTVVERLGEAGYEAALRGHQFNDSS